MPSRRSASTSSSRPSRRRRPARACSSSRATAPRATRAARSPPAQRPTSSTSPSSPTSRGSSTRASSTRDWNANEHKGIPFGSVVTIVVRKGNPKGIKDWDDLLKPGVEVVTPNPFSSGSAKWNLLAPYAAKSNGGADKAAGLAYVTALVKDHVKIQPKSGREATEAFLQGSGDVLLSYENEALFIEKNGDPVEHVTPPTTFKIENPAAVLKGSKNLAKATAFNEYLYTPEAQKLLAEAGFRPVDETVAKEFAAKFPAPDEALDDRRPRRLEDASTARSSRRTSVTSPRSTTRRRNDGEQVRYTTGSRGGEGRHGRRRQPAQGCRSSGAPAGASGREDRAVRGGSRRHTPVRRHADHGTTTTAPAAGSRPHPRRRGRHAVAQRHRPAAARGPDGRRRSRRASPASGRPSPRRPPSRRCG